MGNGNWVKSVWYLIGPTKLVAFGILTPCLCTLRFRDSATYPTLKTTMEVSYRRSSSLFSIMFFSSGFPVSFFFQTYQYNCRWVWALNCGTYGYGSIPTNNNTIFNGMNIHLPAILMFTRGTRFWHTAIWTYDRASEGQWFQGQDLWGQRYFSGVEQLESDLAHYRSHAANLADLADRWFIPGFIGFQPSKVVDFATIHSITRKLDHIESLEVFYNSSPQK